MQKVRSHHGNNSVRCVEKLQNTSIPIRGPAAADHETPSSLKSLYFKVLYFLGAGEQVYMETGGIRDKMKMGNLSLEEPENAVN
ncbi:Proline-Rich Protein 32 [Manis pentadactyla]|nr:Proline-Rich Protein 32 [Manis pentadactyla]